MSKFDTVHIEKYTSIIKEGMEIKAYIAGVNSGSYELPFVISVKTWAKKFLFKKFFLREMKLNIFEVKLLRDELNKAIEFYNNTNNLDI